MKRLGTSRFYSQDVPIEEPGTNAVIRSAVNYSSMLRIVFPLFADSKSSDCVGMKFISEGLDISEAQKSCAFLFSPKGFRVFTRPASEKGCTDGELHN